MIPGSLRAKKIAKTPEILRPILIIAINADKALIALITSYRDVTLYQLDTCAVEKFYNLTCDESDLG